MFARRDVLGLFLVCLSVGFTGCSNPSGLDSVSISPTSQALTVGQTAQFSATGTFGNANHETTQAMTAGVTWTSSAPSVATVSSSGLVTAVTAGTTTITGSATAYNGPVTSTATVTVTGSSGSTASGSVSSISIIPNAQAVSAPGQTSQFIAIGTTSSGATVNLTGVVAWSSSSTTIATAASTGLVTAVGQGTATITALYTNPTGGTVVAGTGNFTVSSGTSQQYTALAITPSTEALSATGQTGQFIALGTSGSTGVEQNVTSASQIAWSSSVPSVATVSASGLVTGVSAGTTTITAMLTNAGGSVVSSTATVNVTISTAPEPLLSLTVVPSSITVDNLQDTGQFLAIGTFSTAPYVRDLTNSSTLTWISDVPSVFPVDTNTGGNSGASAGLVTAYGSGGATIIAEATSGDGTIQTATATFNCPEALPNPNGDPPTPGTCIPGTQADALLATLTIYNEGLNTTTWEVTAPSATGTADVLHCGPGWTGSGGSVCTATYPIGASVVLTASGGQFGGWSYNCAPSDQNGNLLTNPTITAAGPNYCVITFTAGSSTAPANSNVTVGAIFN
jgi:uncharacterized protein YjdB